MSTHQTQTQTAGQNPTGDADISELDIYDIHTRSLAIKHMPDALINIESLFGVGKQLATNLRKAGFSTIPDIHHNEKWKLTLIEGVGEDTARGLKSLAAGRCEYHFGNYAWKPFKEHDPTIVAELDA